jgi:peptidoglycan/xylan/chitin deacetylase (PgdA/CDA1 family)
MSLTIVIYILTLTLLCAGLAFTLTRFNFWRRPRPPFLTRTLMFHATDTAPWPGMRAGLNVAPDLLDFMIGYLKRKGYVFVTADELLTFTEPVRHVCMTFDDGFEDNYTYLFPLLKKHQVKATVFAAPRSVFVGKPMLTPAQIKEMADSGLVEFGGHTLNHIKLTAVPEEDAEKEILAGKTYLESITGKPCTSFCYPFGQFTDRDIALLKKHGFKCSFTCEKGIHPITDPYRIHRLSAHGRMKTWQFPLVLSRGKYKV